MTRAPASIPETLREVFAFQCDDDRRISTMISSDDETDGDVEKGIVAEADSKQPSSILVHLGVFPSGMEKGFGVIPRAVATQPNGKPNKRRVVRLEFEPAAIGTRVLAVWGGKPSSAMQSTHRTMDRATERYWPATIRAFTGEFCGLTDLPDDALSRFSDFAAIEELAPMLPFLLCVDVMYTADETEGKRLRLVWGSALDGSEVASPAPKSGHMVGLASAGAFKMLPELLPDVLSLMNYSITPKRSANARHGPAATVVENPIASSPISGHDVVFQRAYYTSRFTVLTVPNAVVVEQAKKESLRELQVRWRRLRVAIPASPPPVLLSSLRGPTATDAPASARGGVSEDRPTSGGVSAVSCSRRRGDHRPPHAVPSVAHIPQLVPSSTNISSSSVHSFIDMRGVDADEPTVVMHRSPSPIRKSNDHTPKSHPKDTSPVRPSTSLITSSGRRQAEPDGIVQPPRLQGVQSDHTEIVPYEAPPAYDTMNISNVSEVSQQSHPIRPSPSQAPYAVANRPSANIPDDIHARQAQADHTFHPRKHSPPMRSRRELAPPIRIRGEEIVHSDLAKQECANQDVTAEECVGITQGPREGDDEADVLEAFRQEKSEEIRSLLQKVASIEEALRHVLNSSTRPDDTNLLPFSTRRRQEGSAHAETENDVEYSTAVEVVRTSPRHMPFRNDNSPPPAPRSELNQKPFGHPSAPLHQQRSTRGAAEELQPQVRLWKRAPDGFPPNSFVFVDPTSSAATMSPVGDVVELPSSRKGNVSRRAATPPSGANTRTSGPNLHGAPRSAIGVDQHYHKLVDKREAKKRLAEDARRFGSDWVRRQQEQHNLLFQRDKRELDSSPVLKKKRESIHTAERSTSPILSNSRGGTPVSRDVSPSNDSARRRSPKNELYDRLSQPKVVPVAIPGLRNIENPSQPTTGRAIYAPPPPLLVTPRNGEPSKPRVAAQRPQSGIIAVVSQTPSSVRRSISPDFDVVASPHQRSPSQNEGPGRPRQVLSDPTSKLSSSRFAMPTLEKFVVQS